ncbi:helix-turn-helix transcriptional regulator [Streptacidiphilus griseoplanus]|uniref:helix-turn-helix transcriptional regulator n=1 Tax=Peterkaempfera griseoplana TaxID=66896 RepID=UPI001FE1D695|nr:helix-turn-helix transcriptional regulator [Peterkaempfera griseoplana]
MTGRQAHQQTELAQFLRAMRARLRPEDVGLPRTDRRRTPGLRRQEVAQLAAVSVDWYIRLEQGRVGTPGTAVLDALAQALRLSPSERRHLHVISRGEAPVAPHVPAPVEPSLRVLLDGMPLLPAYVVDFRFDVLAHNAAARALFGEDFGTGDAANTARMLFLLPDIREMQLDWERVARETVGNLRANLARHRDDAPLRRLVAELRDADADFASWWDDHTIRQRAHGTKRLRHPTGGDLTVCYDALATLQGSEQCLVAVTPADAAAERVLRRLVAARAAALTGPGRQAVGA